MKHARHLLMATDDTYPGGIPPHLDGEAARRIAEDAAATARQGMGRDGLEKARIAITIAQRLDRPDLEAQGLGAAALCHASRGDQLMAIACAVDAYCLFASLDDALGMGHNLMTIASACREVDAPELAIEALSACRRVATELNDPFLESRACNTLGLVLGDQGEFNEAEAAFVMAEKMLFDSAHEQFAPRVLANRGNLFKKHAQAVAAMGDTDAANAYLKEGLLLAETALVMANESVSRYDIADCETIAAEICYLLHNYRRARELLTDAIAQGGMIGHAQLVVEARLLLARVDLAESRHEDAEAGLRRALDDAKKREFGALQVRAHEGLAAVVKALGRTTEAASHEVAGVAAAATRRTANREAQREVRRMWQRYFAAYPLKTTED